MNVVTFAVLDLMLADSRELPIKDWAIKDWAIKDWAIAALKLPEGRLICSHDGAPGTTKARTDEQRAGAGRTNPEQRPRLTHAALSWH